MAPDRDCRRSGGRHVCVAVLMVTGQPGQGPLAGEYPATVAKTTFSDCMPQTGPGDNVAAGLVVLDPIQGKATINTVSLRGADNMTLTGAFTVPVVESKGGGSTLPQEAASG